MQNLIKWTIRNQWANPLNRFLSLLKLVTHCTLYSSWSWFTHLCTDTHGICKYPFCLPLHSQYFLKSYNLNTLIMWIKALWLVSAWAKIVIIIDFLVSFLNGLSFQVLGNAFGFTRNLKFFLGADKKWEQHPFPHQRSFLAFPSVCAEVLVCVHKTLLPSFRSPRPWVFVGIVPSTTAMTKRGRTMLELKGFSALFWIVPCTNTSKPISRDRSLSFRTQRLAFQPTQSQQTLKNGYITVNVCYSWTSSKLLICWDTMYPQVLKHSMRSFLLGTLEARTHRSEDYQFIKWIRSLWFYEEIPGP